MWWRSDPVLLVQASEEPLAVSQLASQTLWNVKKYGDLFARNSSCKKRGDEHATGLIFMELKGATHDQRAAISAWSGRVISGAGCVSEIHGTRGNLWRDPKFAVAVCWNFVSSASNAIKS